MIHRQDPHGHIGVKARSVTAKVCAIVLAVSNTPSSPSARSPVAPGLPLSTAHRLLCELVEGGLLERNTDGRFTVCVELQLLHGPGERAAHARSLVGTVLEDLAAATGLRARLAVWHPTGISYLEQAPDICGSTPRSKPTTGSSTCRKRPRRPALVGSREDSSTAATGASRYPSCKKG